MTEGRLSPAKRVKSCEHVLLFVYLCDVTWAMDWGLFLLLHLPVALLMKRVPGRHGAQPRSDVWPHAQLCQHWSVCNIGTACCGGSVDIFLSFNLSQLFWDRHSCCTNPSCPPEAVSQSLSAEKGHQLKTLNLRKAVDRFANMLHTSTT